MWTPAQKLRGFREMCKGVQRLRKLGIAHRDIKPPNFLVTASDEVKLSDFGTARYVDGTASAISPSYSGRPGDIRYASPEMIAMLHDDEPAIAIAADVYALGATFFEMWSGAVLGIQVFTPQLLADLNQAMHAVPKRDRIRIYSRFIPGLAAANPLPTIAVYGADLPLSIRGLVEHLYRSMSALDYRQRLHDFGRIFLRIDQCILILDNEEKIRNWQRRKEVFRRNRETNRALALKRCGQTAR
jgi:serine/threonine protein kinase